MKTFENKLVAVLNEKIEPGKVMNALAHMSIGLGAVIGKEKLRLVNYTDADQGHHENISEMPFMILKANSNKIRELRKLAIQNGLSFVDFTDTMTIGTSEEQLARTSEIREENLIYYGLVVFGQWDTVSELTRKFSLWK